MDLKNKIFLFDVNHTLINTAAGHLHAMNKMVAELIKGGIDKKTAKEIVKRVHFSTSLMIAGFLINKDKEWDYVPGGKEAYKELTYRIYNCQEKILKKWGFIKKWSREVFIKIATDDLGMKLSPEIVIKAADAHWEGITFHAEIFSSARILFKELKKHKIPAYILTSSDGRLIPKNSHFVYDPKYSEAAKRKRMMVLKTQGIDFTDIVIGDPYDKPSVEFFNNGLKAIEKNLGYKIKLSDLVMVGNSYEDDLETPITKMKFGLGILVEEGRKNKKKSGKIIRIGDLTQIIDLL